MRDALPLGQARDRGQGQLDRPRPQAVEAPAEARAVRHQVFAHRGVLQVVALEDERDAGRARAAQSLAQVGRDFVADERGRARLPFVRRLGFVGRPGLVFGPRGLLRLVEVDFL